MNKVRNQGKSSNNCKTRHNSFQKPKIQSKEVSYFCSCFDLFTSLDLEEKMKSADLSCPFFYETSRILFCNASCTMLDNSKNELLFLPEEERKRDRFFSSRADDLTRTRVFKYPATRVP